MKGREITESGSAGGTVDQETDNRPKKNVVHANTNCQNTELTYIKFVWFPHRGTHAEGGTQANVQVMRFNNVNNVFDMYNTIIYSLVFQSVIHSRVFRAGT